jgi:predicted transglutaminase-like cysteine proteinase
VAQARGSSEALLQKVNAYVNTHIAYVPDASDTWLTPTEALRQGGDCEDYAIAKFLLLRSAGISAARMKIVALRAQPGSAAHAVLVVDGAQVLDNESQKVYRLSLRVTERVAYAFNESKWWIPAPATSRFQPSS